MTVTNPDSLTVRQNATNAAMSGGELDIPTYVEMFALRKSGIEGQGSVWSTRKGKTALFAQVAAFIKSRHPHLNQDGKVPSNVADEIHAEIERFFRRKVDAMFSEYSRFSFKGGGLSARVDAKGNLIALAKGSFTGERDTRSDSETKLAISLSISRLEELSNYHLDKGNFDRVTELNKQIERLRVKYAAIGKKPEMPVAPGNSETQTAEAKAEEKK